MMPLTGIVKHLLIINVIFFIGMHLIPEGWKEMLSLYSPTASPELYAYLNKIRPELIPYYDDVTGLFKPFQIITHMFSHAGLEHIFFNMLSLFFLGPTVEASLGAKRFLGLYFISGLAGLAAHFLVGYFPYFLGWTPYEPSFSVLGASGAIFGVVIAFATLFPDRELMLLFPPIPIKAWVMATILICMGLYSGLTGSDVTVAHFAHLGGALAGFILARHWKHGGGFLK